MQGLGGNFEGKWNANINKVILRIHPEGGNIVVESHVKEPAGPRKETLKQV